MSSSSSDISSREARKAEALAPYIEAALARKRYMQPLAEHEVPVVKASVKAATFDGLKTRQAAGGGSD